MRVALEARVLSTSGSGIKTYVSELVKGLENRDDVDLVALKEGSENPWWLEATAYNWMKDQDADVVHCTKSAVPRRKLKNTVVTIYDVIPLLFPQSQKFLAYMYWKYMLPHAAKSADRIITISEKSKKDIVKYLSVEEEKVVAIPLAVNPSASAEATADKVTPAPYILYVGAIEPRKNVPALVRAFAKIASQVPHKLVIAGKEYKGLDKVRAEIITSGLEDRVEVKGFVEKSELDDLYANADLFVWPSIYEGWGFPPLEAMAHGVPVIVSDGGSLSEVVGEAAVTVPFSTDELAGRINDADFEARLSREMLKVIGDDHVQAGLVAAGEKRVQELSWGRVVQSTVDVYQELL